MLVLRKILLILTIIICSANTTATNNEYMVKLNFISRFSNFITWKQNPSKAFMMATIKENPFSGVSTSKLKAKNLPIEIQTVSDAAGISNVKTVFIPFSYKGDISPIVKKCIENNMLCISERDGLAEKGTMINLIRKSGKIQFEINKKSVDSSGLKFNSQLFKLASKVY